MISYWYLLIEKHKVTNEMKLESITQTPRALGNLELYKFDRPYPESCTKYGLFSEKDLRTILETFDEEPTKWEIKQIIKAAKAFGDELAEDFSSENVMMGITQEGMTGYALKKGGFLLTALSSGSLYEAYQCVTGVCLDGVTPYPDAIAPDDKYFSPERLQRFAARLAGYLGIGE